MPRPAVDAGSDEGVRGRLVERDGVGEVGGRGRHGRRPQDLRRDDDGEAGEGEWGVLEGAKAGRVGVLEHEFDDADQVRDVVFVAVVQQERYRSAQREEH